MSDILNETNYDWSSIVESIQIGADEEPIPGSEIAWPKAQHFLGCVPIDIQGIIHQNNISLGQNLEIFLTIRNRKGWS